MEAKSLKKWNQFVKKDLDVTLFVFIANKAAKQSTTVGFTPVDVFKDTWRYFKVFCGNQN